MASAPDVDATYFGERSVRDWWLRCRDALLAEWIAERPGTRPAGWWTFDRQRWQHPDIPAALRGEYAIPRLIEIDGELVEPEYPGGRPTMHCGLFALPPWREVYDGEEMTPHPVESQAAYLRRHGLLEPGEAARCRNAPDVEEVSISLEAYSLGLDRDDSEPWKGE